nr:MAG TPA: hypothetical protein [Caudoviricetes sp.]
MLINYILRSNSTLDKEVSCIFYFKLIFSLTV